MLIVCVGLATASIAAVGFGLFDQLIESFPGRGTATATPGAEGAGRVVEGEAGAAGAAASAPDGPEAHRAIYRAGKLYLEGAVPSEAVAAAFEEKAAEVIGADNVINNYVIDPRAEEPTDGRVIVDEPFLFAFDSADIDPQFHGLLDLGVLVMDLNPQAKIRVVGHADATGTSLYNEELSLARAAAVAAYLIDNGVGTDRINVQGRGERRPIADNATSGGRALNRRIEIELLNLLA